MSRARELIEGQLSEARPFKIMHTATVLITYDEVDLGDPARKKGDLEKKLKSLLGSKHTVSVTGIKKHK